MSLREIVRTVRANWIVALVTFLVCVGGGLAYVVLPAKEYKASVVLVAEPPQTANDPGALVGAIQIEIPQIVVEAGTPVVANQASAKVPANLRSVPVTITATGDPASNTVTINATSTNPLAAQAYANATAARVVRVTNLTAHPVLVLSQLGSAALPTSPTNPRKTVLVASFAIGFILAVFAALAAGALRKYVVAEEVGEQIGLPVLGEVPALARPGSSPVYMFEYDGDPHGLEAFQQIRTALHVMFPDGHPIIAVTSCEPREGKSSVAAHTAWALATPAHPVAVVDGDLRHPTLHDLFGLPLSPGVSDFDNAYLTDLMAPTRNHDLVLVAGGVPTRHPVDVAAAIAPRLLGALQESDRTVVLDCPPINGVAETTILVARADAVIVVVDVRKLDFERLEQGLAHLRASGAVVVGVVLNRVRKTKAASAYSYGRTPEAEATEESKRKNRLLARLG